MAKPKKIEETFSSEDTDKDTHAFVAKYLGEDYDDHFFITKITISGDKKKVIVEATKH